MRAPIATRLAAVGGASILLAGCCVRAVAPPVSDDERRILDAHVKAGRCVVTGVGPSVSDLDVISAANAIERTAVFAEVVSLTANADGTSGSGWQQFAENADWRVELVRADTAPALNGFWDMTLVHFVTFGLIPLVRTGDNVRVYRVRRGDEPQAAGRGTTERASRDAVCGWVALPMSLLPGWEMDRATLAASRDDDRLAVELLRAMGEGRPGELDR